MCLENFSMKVVVTSYGFKKFLSEYGFKNFLSESHIVTWRSLGHISLSISSRVALFWAKKNIF